MPSLLEAHLRSELRFPLQIHHHLLQRQAQSIHSPFALLPLRCAIYLLENYRKPTRFYLPELYQLITGPGYPHLTTYHRCLISGIAATAITNPATVYSAARASFKHQLLWCRTIYPDCFLSPPLTHPISSFDSPNCSAASGCLPTFSISFLGRVESL